MDQYGRMEASEAAAATASYIFSHSQDMEDFGDGSYRRSRSRHNSFSYGSQYPSPHSYGSGYDNGFDPYAYDRDHMRGSRRHRRGSSASRLMIGQPGYDTYGSSPISIPGSSFGGGYHPSSFGGGFAGSYPVSPSYPVGGGVPYAGSYGGVPTGGSLIVTKPRRHRSSSRHRHGRSRSRSVIIPGTSYAGSGGFY
jgi:hypothetical protein